MPPGNPNARCPGNLRALQPISPAGVGAGKGRQYAPGSKILAAGTNRSTARGLLPHDFARLLCCAR
jgi:hypothetical protein